MKNEQLYKDRFLTLTEWMGSATLQAILGAILTILSFVYVHWFVSLIVIFLTLVGVFASYMVYKK